MINLDPKLIRLQIENLKISHPEVMEDDESWQISLESETELFNVLAMIVRKIEDAKALVIGMKDRFEELEQRKDRFEHRIEVMRELAFSMMQAAEVSKVELPEATLSLRKGTQQLIGDISPVDMPDEYCKISRSLDRTKIKDALKAGKTAPGFSLSNATPQLSIRIK